MTENIELCRLVCYRDDDGTEVWRPLDPDPDCKNCDRGVLDGYETGTYCKKMDELHLEWIIPHKVDFCCKYYIPKVNDDTSW